MQLRIMMAFGESVFVDYPDSEEGYAEVFKAISSTLLLEVKAVHECSPEAVAAFAAIVCHE